MELDKEAFVADNKCMCINVVNMTITKATCNNIPGIEQEFLASLLVGKAVEDGLQRAIKEIRIRYFSVTQRAMIASIKDLLRCYRDYQRKAGGENY